jgi:hypothetical protein
MGRGREGKGKTYRMRGEERDILAQHTPPNDTRKKPYTSLRDHGGPKDQVVVNRLVNLLGSISDTAKKRLLLAKTLLLCGLLFGRRHVASIAAAYGGGLDLVSGGRRGGLRHRGSLVVFGVRSFTI